MNRLTDHDRDKFFEYVEYWQTRLNLNHWAIRRSNKPTKYLAEVRFDVDKSHKFCTVHVGKNWGAVEVNDKSLKSTALHEILHVLLYDLIEYAKEHPYDHTGMLEKEHEVVHNLEKVLMKE